MLQTFITGTGTDVGKTIVATALCHGLTQLQHAPTYWKPVQTGPAPTDSDMVARLCGPNIQIQPTQYYYPLAASPDQAAAAAKKEPANITQLLTTLGQLKTKDSLIVEGAGGLLVPLNEAGETWVNFLQKSRLPALIVASTELGTINHTSLTLQHLHDRGLEVAGVVLSGSPHEANALSLARAFPDIAFFHLPHLPLNDAEKWTPHSTALAEFVLAAISRRTSAVAPPSAWLNYDKAHVWHPYTQHQSASAPLAITQAEGVWLTTQDGQRLIDGTSSWWVNTIGHGRPEIAQALATQQKELDHVIFAGVTHEPASRLAHQLALLTEQKLPRVFFSDNGSTAIEVALKMAWQSFTNRGDYQRRSFLSFRGSYHGDTFGAMSIAAADDFHGAFRPLLFKTVLANPVTWHPSRVCPEGLASYDETMAALKNILSEQASVLAGVVIEPLVQGASGMLMQPPAFLQELSQLCRQYGLPLIVDEVFTGFGRVGAPFAYQRAGIEPDIICAAKAITGGTLPLAVTLCREEFFADFLANEPEKALMHGHSYTANAIACRVALTALDITAREQLWQRALKLEQRYQSWLANAAAEYGIENGRALGGILAFELPHSGLGAYFHQTAKRIPEIAMRHGLFLRPLGNSLYFMPPLVISDEELEQALLGLEAILKSLA